MSTKKKLSDYKRPDQLPEQYKLQIQDLFNKEQIRIDFENEFVVAYPMDHEVSVGFVTEVRIPMDALGKMIAIINNAGGTVRKK